MNVFSIPEDLEIDSSKSIQLVNYKSNKATSRQQVKLTRNTFSFLVEGEKEVITHEKSITIPNSQFLLMKTSRCLMTETLSTSQKAYQSILLFFTDDVLTQFIHKHSLQINNKADRKDFKAFDYDTYIRNFVHDLEETSVLPATLQNKLLPLKLEEILLYLVETQGSHILAPFLVQSNQLLSIVVENNKIKKLSLQELAFLCNMSVSTFKREFEKHYKESPIKWFQKQRLEHAAYLLHEKKQRPSEIYFEAGYENLSSFIQAYKAQFGNTPKQDQLS